MIVYSLYIGHTIDNFKSKANLGRQSDKQNSKSIKDIPLYII